MARQVSGVNHVTYLKNYVTFASPKETTFEVPYFNGKVIVKS